MAIQRDAIVVFAESIPAIGMPPHTDARLYAAHGFPIVLYSAGQRPIIESNAKRADENLLPEDLREATRNIASAVPDLPA